MKNKIKKILKLITIDSDKLELDITNNLSSIKNIISTQRKILLKNETFASSEKIPQPYIADANTIIKSYSIGYSCNLLNNLFTFCKIARKNGINAKLFLDPKFSDIAVTSLPHWEEVEFQDKEMPNNLSGLLKWDLPDFINTVDWNLDYFNSISLLFEYEKLQEFFRDSAIDIKVGDEISYLLAYTVIPHRDLIKLYNGVDILHVSGAHIGVASFSNKPYVTFPYGADLYSLPFEDNEIGWMQKRGFRKATRHIISGKAAMDYIEQLGISRRKIDLIPYVIDTDVYAPMLDNPLRSTTREQFPGKIIFLLGSRQNWAWKGNDKLWRAIAKVNKITDKALFFAVWYGQDLDKSGQLIEDLKIENNIKKIGVLSKPSLKKYIDAADVCIDQFTVGALGTFALESMSCAKPLVTYFNPEAHFSFEDKPPLLNAFSEDELVEAIIYCINNHNTLSELGYKHRSWIERYHGHKALWPAYDQVYKKAIMDYRFSC